MVRITWKVTFNKIPIAKNNRTLIMEGKQYFPPESVKMEYLKESETKGNCPWRGEISYYDIVVDGVVSKDAACYFAETNPDALKKVGKDYKNYITFIKDVETVVDV